ncbi:protein kinase domain-containing protein [Streptomyces sp. 4N509B]|uniref:protein kinase domain-containing protein n=1 Tax=Streptomyces sp. 4N509B TaxID=3457413 RepID=UPI003FD69C20
MEALEPDDPTTIGPYRLLGWLGSGGMGRVYLGRSGSGRTVAVKVVHSDLARDPEFRRRFRAEVEAARRVSGVWTAPVLEADTESTVPWVATGYVAGAPLRQVVNPDLHGPLPEQTVWALAFGLAHALTEIHDSGLIHRDLKPSNVMVTLEGPKVIDFGIARAVDASVVTRTGGTLGSPGYMPPEQITNDQPLTGAVDVFALGAVLAYAATGVQPFSWDEAHLHTVQYRVMNLEPHLGPEDGPLGGELRALVARCLAKDPAQRPALAEIIPLAEARAGTAFWLPQGLTAWLGRNATKLLDLDGPPAPVMPGAAAHVAGPSSVPSAPGAPSAIPGDTTFPSGHHTPPVPRTPATPVTPVTPGMPVLPGMPAPPGGPGGPGTPGTPPTPVHPPRVSGLPAPPVWRRPRVALAAAAGAVALALTAWIVVANGGEGGGGAQAGDSGGNGGGSSQEVDDGEGAAGGNGDEGGPDAGADAPLAHRVPREVRDAGGITVHSADRDGDPILSLPEGGDVPVGFEVDLVEEMAALLGVPVTYAQPTEEWPEAVEEAIGAAGDDGAWHIALATLAEDEVEGENLDVGMVEHYRDGWSVLSDDPNRSGDLADLCGLTVVTYDGDVNTDAVRSNTEHCENRPRVRTFGSRDDMVDAIQAGDADVAMLTYTKAAGWIRENPDEGMYVAPGSLGTRGIAVPERHGELEIVLLTALDMLQENGTYAELLDRWSIPEAAVD